MNRIKYFSNQIKDEKTRFGKGNLENDVIHDAQKGIWDKNLEKFSGIGKFGVFGKFGDIGTIGDIDTGSILAKNRKIA